MKINIVIKHICNLVLLLWLSACTTINVDHIKLEKNLQIRHGDAVVVLGRHNSAQSETETSLVSCIGKKLQSGLNNLTIIPEQEFVDLFYPWFEARTAPMHPDKLKRIFDLPLISQRLEELKVHYFVWIEGSTERTSSTGSMSCAIGPGGGGCFGFGAWEDTSDYETIIWDLETFKEVGRVSTEAVGTSYMPAFVVPIPMLARVEGDACKGMGKQLVEFFKNDSNQIKKVQ